MNVHIDPDAQHAVYAPSSAHRWTICTASAEAISRLPSQESGEAAIAGTEAHEELERVLGGNVADPDHPAAYAVALAVDYIKRLPMGRTWIEERVALSPQIWGRCDFAHWHAETSTLTIVDLKNGYVGVDADAEQLQVYAAACLHMHKLSAEYIRLVIVQPNDFRPGVPRVKQHIMSGKELSAFAQRISNIPTSPKKFVAGEQCTYCPLFGKCEASRDILANLGALVAGLMQPADVPPDQRALFRACEKPIKDAFSSADKMWLKDELAGNHSPGLKVITTQKHRAWISEQQARAFVLNRFGVDALDPPTPAQVEKLGATKEEIGTLAVVPDGGPALAFESDTRKPWAPKSAAEMFGDVLTSR